MFQRRRCRQFKLVRQHYRHQQKTRVCNSVRCRSSPVRIRRGAATLPATSTTQPKLTESRMCIGSFFSPCVYPPGCDTSTTRWTVMVWRFFFSQYQRVNIRVVAVNNTHTHMSSFLLFAIAAHMRCGFWSRGVYGALAATHRRISMASAETRWTKLIG